MTWTRARTAGLCGLCGRDVAAGDPIFVVRIDGVGPPILKARCARVTCAGPAPPDLPLEIARDPLPPVKPLTPLFQALPFDWRPVPTPLSDREPGEDG